jgi:hypothetical protein
MIFDIPFGYGISGLLITRSRALFFRNPLAPILLLAVKLLDRYLGFATKFANGLSLCFDAVLSRKPLEPSIHEL